MKFMTNATRAALKNQGMTGAQSACLESLISLAEGIALRAPRRSGGIVPPGYSSRLSDVIKPLGDIALAAPDGPEKAKICADLLLKLHTTPDEAVRFLGRISGFAEERGLQDWIDAFRRAGSCSSRVNPLQILVLSLKQMKYEKPQVKAVAFYGGAAFERALESFVGDLGSGAFEISALLKKARTLNTEAQELSTEAATEAELDFGPARFQRC